MDQNLSRQLLNNPTIVNNIMSSMYDVDPNIKYRQLNKQIYNETGQFFYDKYCDLLINNKEIRDYLLSKPNKFGSVLATVFNNNGTQEIALNNNYYELSPFVNIIYYVSTFTLDYHIDDQGNSILSNTIDVDVVSADKVNQLVASCRDYDLLTIFKVYQNRVNCMKVNERYAKEKILQEFEKRFMVNDNDSLFNLYYSYQYMLLNCYVFNMGEQPRLMDDLIVNDYDIPDDLSDGQLMDYFEDMLNGVEEKTQNQLSYFFVDEIERLKPLLLKHIMRL